MITIGDDMKKNIKLMIFLLLFLPFVINAASTFNEGKAKTGNYITSFENYKRYIHFPSNSSYYAYEASGYNSANGNGFKNGGFISSFEYNLSLENNFSWLSPGIGYWTLSKKSDSEYYYIADKLYSKDKNSISSARITEYVINTAKIKGNGTVSNPWYFVDAFRIRLRSNNESYGNLGTGSNLGPKELDIEKGTTKTIGFTANPGYSISTSNISNCAKEYFEVNSNNLTIKSLDRDLNCIINFEPKQYTVSLNSNGGTPTSYIHKVTYKEKYGSMPEPSRTGYTFAGWYTAARGGNKISADSDVTITSNQTLYAHWNANVYRVTFVGNGGKMGSTTTKDVSYGSEYGDLSKITATRTGYTFTGWYTAASGGTKVTSTTKVTQTKNHTLYAQWKLGTYTVTLNAAGGQLSKSSITVTYTQKYGTIPTPTKIGYTFLGWYTASSGGTRVTSDTRVTQTKNHTLYAQWKADRITCPELTYKCSNISKGSDYKLTYNGKCEVTCENENWKVKFLTSGTLTTTVSLNVDVFLVGGGGGGYTTSYSVGGAGGGGYTKTVKNITLQPNTYKIDVGAGGGGGQNGKSSTVKLNNAIIEGLSAEGGKTGTISGGCCGNCSWGGAGGNNGGGWSDCNEGTPFYPTTFGGGSAQNSTTCEFGEGTTTKCNTGVKQYSGGGCCGCCYTPSAGGGACSGGNGQANTGGGGGAYYLNEGSGGSGIVIFRDKR